MWDKISLYFLKIQKGGAGKCQFNKILLVANNDTYTIILFDLKFCDGGYSPHLITLGQQIKAHPRHVN